MGYDINRFEGNVDEELICPICSQILEEPVQVTKKKKKKKKKVLSIDWWLIDSDWLLLVSRRPSVSMRFVAGA